MRNIPLFTTENGIASLTLEEIPYKSCAYIRIQAASNQEVFIKECADFCVAVGAEHVYATGAGAENYPHCNNVVQMFRTVSNLPDTDAVVCSVREDTLEQWRNIYNRRMCDVSNAATMTVTKAKEVFKSGGCYFVYKNDCLLGIGMITDRMINAIATVVPGTGKDVLIALCRAAQGETVCVEVSDTNLRAMKLYQQLGFTKKIHVADWYKII